MCAKFIIIAFEFHGSRMLLILACFWLRCTQSAMKRAPEPAFCNLHSGGNNFCARVENWNGELDKKEEKPMMFIHTADLGWICMFGDGMVPD
jgi:hypothetical protein